jgi:mono/diheme cytochrome c family protein
MRPLLATLAATLGATLLAVLSSCGGTNEHSRGRALYRLQGCHTCHGQGAQGLPTAPALRNLSELWDREALIEYFANPRAFVEGDQRLGAMRGRFNVEMPAIVGTPDELGALADYVLSL